MIALVDPKGGEMPLARYCTEVGQFEHLVETIGKIMINLKPHLKDEDKMLAYCFCFQTGFRGYLHLLMNGIESTVMPKSCEFYEVDGNRIFDVRGASGGITTMVCCYLIVR